jgi:UDP-N-acetylmuramate dehydrogenase
MQKLNDLGCRIHKDEPLSKYSSLKIGGPADFLVEIPNLKALILLTNSVREKLFLIGGATNILFHDEGFRGVVFKLAGEFKDFIFDDCHLTCGAAALLPTIINESAKRGLSGFEHFAAGIPGTIGGAVFGNAGNAQRGICELIESIEILEDGERKVLNKADLRFSYRHSGILGIVLRVSFALQKGSKEEILKTIAENIAKRSQSQPKEPNIGCIFKNPKGFSAGALIDKAGLKGKRIGGAQISDVHGNFIVNKGGASAADVGALMDIIKTTIKEKFSLELETEIMGASRRQWRLP